MTVLLTMAALLLVLQWRCARQARRVASHMMRPAADWDADDIDRWLELIEPFPLPDPTPRRG